MVTAAMKLKDTCSMEEKLWHGRKSMTNLVSILKGERFIWSEVKPEYRQHIKKQRHHFVNTCSYSQIYGFSSSHAWMWELNQREWWALKKSCFQTGAGEDCWEYPGQQGDQTSHSWRKSTPNILWKDWCRSWSPNTLVTWCEEPTH